MKATPITRPAVQEAALSFGERIKAQRVMRGWTQAKVGELAGINAVSICQYEKGKVAGMHMAAKIARAFGIATDKLTAGLDMSPGRVHKARQAATPRLGTSEEGLASQPSRGIAPERAQPLATSAHPAGVKARKEVEPVELVDIAAIGDLHHAARFGAENHCFCEGDAQCVFHAALARAKVLA